MPADLRRGGEVEGLLGRAVGSPGVGHALVERDHGRILDPGLGVDQHHALEAAFAGHREAGLLGESCGPGQRGQASVEWPELSSAAIAGRQGFKNNHVEFRLLGRSGIT